jgi:hypothetical protein
LRTLLVATALAVLTSPALAQDDEQKRPEGWNVRFDQANSNADDLLFVGMPPGWHVTSGPAGIYYHPDSTVSGNYTLTSTINTFDPKGRNREAFGVILGGKNLDAPNQDYVYFLIRNTGEFLVKHRGGSETHVMIDWQASDAIDKYVEGQEGTAINKLSVAVMNGTATFLINDTEVASHQASPDGVFGLRVNHGINLHIRDLSVSR